MTAQKDTSAPRKTGGQESGKTECNYTDKNYTELIRSIHPSRNGFTAGQSVIRPAKSSHTTGSDTLRRRCPRKYGICVTNATCQGYAPETHPQQRSVIACAEGIPPSVRRQGRVLAVQPSASRPIKGAGLDCGPPAGLEAAKGITPLQGAHCAPCVCLGGAAYS